jgi:hypothetical protein
MNEKIFYIDTNVSLLVAFIFIFSYFLHLAMQKRYKIRMLGGLVYPTAFTL